MLVFDKFHIVQNVNVAVDSVRKQEHRTLATVGASPHARTKYAWLRNSASSSASVWWELAALRISMLQTAKACAMKESLRQLWDYTYVGAARTFFRRWYGWVIRLRLEPMKRVERMLRRHLENIMTYLTHRITNVMTEGLNAEIQWIKYRARGYRDREALKMAIYFYCGGLDFGPACTEHTHSKPGRAESTFHRNAFMS